MQLTRRTSSFARCSGVSPAGRAVKRSRSTSRGAAPPSSIAMRLASSTCEHSSARKSLVIPRRSSGAFTSTSAREHFGERRHGAVLVDRDLCPRSRARSSTAAGRVLRRVERSPRQLVGRRAGFAEVVLGCTAHPFELEGLLHAMCGLPGPGVLPLRLVMTLVVRLNDDTDRCRKRRRSARSRRSRRSRRHSARRQ